MRLISHRGNINGIESVHENNPNYIENAIMLGFDVEIDVRYENNSFFLGHDTPDYKVNSKFLEMKGIWCHAKDADALENLRKLNCVYFWHQEDDYTITSNGYFWVYPGKKLIKNSICVLPEKTNLEIVNCYGICSDIIMKYKND